MRRDLVSEAHDVDRLSKHEWRRYQQIGNPERRERWLAGRLLAKQLFLGLLDDGRAAARPRVIRLGRADLRLYPAWLCRAVEILPDRPEGPGCSWVHWLGRRCPIHLSLSHAADVTAACLSWRGAVGVDVETICDRSDTFHAGNFTPAERRWAGAVRREIVERAYTLLWCLKESAMKLRQSDRVSLWELPRVEVRLASPVGAAADLLSYDELLGDRLSGGDAEITESGGAFRARITVTATRNLLLTCMMRRDERSKEM